MLFYSILFFLFTLFWKINSQCLLSNKSSNSCSICSFNYYDSLNQNFYSEPLSVPTSFCLIKKTASIKRNILIFNTNCILCNLATIIFDIEYKSLFEAFMNESKLMNEYYESQIIFFLSKGSHFVMRDDSSTNLINFFRRVKCNYIIKPLYCFEFGFSGFCNMEYEIPKIIFKSINFSFLVSNSFTIYNISFDGIDLSFAKNVFNECLITNQTCCNEDSLKNASNPCFLPPNINNAIISTKYLKGLFQMEIIFDDPNFAIPHLNFFNVNFDNFYINGNDNIFFGSFIIGDYLGGNLKIQSLSFINSFLLGYFVLFDSVSGFAKYDEVYDVLKSFSENIQKQLISINISININRIIFSSYNKVNLQFSKEMMRSSFLYFDGFNGNISITDFKVNNVNILQLSNYLIFANNIKHFHLKNLDLQKITNLNLLYISKSNFETDSIHLESALLNNIFIFLEYSNATFSNLVFVNVSGKYQSSS